MNAREWRATGALALIYAVRMLGLFLLLPVLAIYAHDLPGTTPLLVGLAVGSYGLTQALLQIPFGAWSDRFGRRPVITAGLVLFAAGSVLAGVSDHALGLVAGRALQGAGAVAAAIMALLADLTRDEVRTRAMAVIGIAIGASYLVALPLGPWLAALLGVPAVFLGMAALSGVLVALLWTAVPAPAAPVPAQGRGGFRAVLADRQLLRLDFSILALHAVMTATFVAVPLLLVEQLGLPAARHGGWYLPLVALSVVAMVPLLLWSERGRRLRSALVVSVLLLAAGELLLAGARSLQAAALALVLFLAAFNALEAMLPSLVSRLAPLARRGAALGVYSTSQFFGAFLGGALGGALYGQFGPRMILLGAAALCVVWIPVLAGLRPPGGLLTRVVRVGTIGQEQARALEARLAALAGVAESVVVAEAGVAYLKVDRRVFDPASVDRLLAAGG